MATILLHYITEAVDKILYDICDLQIHVHIDRRLGGKTQYLIMWFPIDPKANLFPSYIWLQRFKSMSFYAY